MLVIFINKSMFELHSNSKLELIQVSFLKDAMSLDINEYKKFNA